MNNANINIFFQFIGLVLVQVLVLNNINFAGFVNPYLYVLFILLYPIKNNRTFFLTLSFLIGLAVDIFSDSGGVNAGASVFIAFMRPIILKFSFGMVYEYQTLKFNNTEIGNRMIYFAILIIVHHFVLFSLEVFNFSEILLILKKTLFSSIFTLILCLFTTVLFNKKER
ncbi:rod shape-determining protein MreD [Flavobacteriaceae bacterium MAR_2010_188]|nr:rod shape-determining protein MreD [Flavobacteriaceae bacterium MAR_2010_188]